MIPHEALSETSRDLVCCDLAICNLYVTMEACLGMEFRLIWDSTVREDDILCLLESEREARRLR
jgi:hypothetical protein